MTKQNDYYDYLKGLSQDPTFKVCIVDELLLRKKYTPDFGELRLYENILVFVYDELKVDGFQSSILSESKFLGEARTMHNSFLMKSSSTNPVVFVNNKPKDINKGYIRGEVYAVPPETLLQLDKAKFNGFLYRRQKKYIFLMDQEYQTKQGNKRPSVEAFMYLGIPEYWESYKLFNAPAIIPKHDRNKKYFDYLPRTRNIYYRGGMEGNNPDYWDQRFLM